MRSFYSCYILILAQKDVPKYICIPKYTHHVILKNTMHFLRLYNCIFSLPIVVEHSPFFSKLLDIYATELRIATVATITENNNS